MPTTRRELSAPHAGTSYFYLSVAKCRHTVYVYTAPGISGISVLSRAVCSSVFMKHCVNVF